MMDLDRRIERGNLFGQGRMAVGTTFKLMQQISVPIWLVRRPLADFAVCIVCAAILSPLCATFI